MEIIPKAGILVEIAAIMISLPIWVTVTITENEYLFAKVFFDKNLHLEKIEKTKSYQTMIEKYTDSIIMTRTHAMHGSSVEMMAYGDDSENELRVDIHFNQMDDYLDENAILRNKQKNLPSNPSISIVI